MATRQEMFLLLWNKSKEIGSSSRVGHYILIHLQCSSHSHRLDTCRKFIRLPKNNTLPSFNLKETRLWIAITLWWLAKDVRVITVHQQSCGKVIFSQVSFILFRWRGSTCDITHDSLDLTVQGPLQTWTWGTPLGPSPGQLLATSGGHHWRSVQTCSLDLPPSQYWHLVVTGACTVGKWAIRILL